MARLLLVVFGALSLLLTACTLAQPAAPIFGPTPTPVGQRAVLPTPRPAATPTSPPVVIPVAVPTSGPEPTAVDTDTATPMPASPTPGRSLTPSPTATPVLPPAASEYSAEAVDYFFEIALGTEYGGAGPVLRRWESDLRLKLYGAPTWADRAALDRVILDLNQLIGTPTLRLVEADADDANVEVHFVPRSQFPELEPNYVPGNIGFFWFWWDSRNAITRARILVAADAATQQQRSHVIREELTQSLGLARDSDRYPESIFYQFQNQSKLYSPLDREIIRLLYDDRLRPGMNRGEIEAALGGQR